jgi:hypothetical protein
MRLSADDYLAAGAERLRTATLVYGLDRFVEAIYLAGLAVECVLRAYARESQGVFDGRHDLRRLGRSLLEVGARWNRRQVLAAALLVICDRGMNIYRYAPERRLRAELKTLQLDRGIRGDTLKENARRALAAATTIVAEGGGRWRKK